MKQIYGVPSVTLHQLTRGSIDHSDPVRITYENKDIFKKTAKALGLMDDFKVGVHLIYICDFEYFIHLGTVLLHIATVKI